MEMDGGIAAAERSKKSIRTGIYFEGSRMALVMVLRVTFLLCLDVPVKVTYRTFALSCVEAFSNSWVQPFSRLLYRI